MSIHHTHGSNNPKEGQDISSADYAVQRKAPIKRKCCFLRLSSQKMLPPTFSNMTRQ